MQALTFNNINFNPVERDDSQTWLTSAELAKALGYTKSSKVTELYHRNKDEFDETMTLTTKLRVKGYGNGNSLKTVRIFSLQGCYLITFFARTKVAKQFRRWISTLLAKSKIEPHPQINQEKLYDICSNTVEMGMEYLSLIHNISTTLANDNDYQLKGIAEKVINAINFSKENNLTNRRNEPMFDCGELNFSYGNKIIYTPKKMAMLQHYSSNS